MGIYVGEGDYGDKKMVIKRKRVMGKRVEGWVSSSLIQMQMYIRYIIHVNTHLYDIPSKGRIPRPKK